MVFIKKVNNSDPGTSDLTGGNDWDKLDDYHDDVDITPAIAKINTITRYRNNKFQLRDAGNDHNYIFNVQNLAADKSINYPLLTSDDEPLFKNFAATLTNKTINQISNPIIQQNKFKYVVFIDAADSNRIKCIDQDTGTIVSNNTSALTTLQFAVDNAAGKPILVKRGTYVLTAELNCADKYVYICGESTGNSSTTFQKAGTGNVISCDNVGTGLYQNVYFENFYVDGVDRLGTGIRFDKVKHCFPVINRVKIQNCLNGIHWTEGWYTNFVELWVENCNKGVWIENNGVPATQLGGGNTLYFYGGKIQGCHTNNLHCDVTNDVSFFGTIFESDDTHLANPVIKLDSESEYNRFYDCSFENYNGGIVIVHDEGRSNRFVNCRFQQTITDLNITSYEAVGARSGSLIGNTFGFSGNGGTGTLTISIDGTCQDMVLLGNTKRRWVEPNNLTFTDTGTRTTRVGNTFCNDKLGITDFRDEDVTFFDNRIRIWNPAGNARYTLIAAAISGNQNLNLPLITGTDTLVSLGLAQTFSSDMTFGAGLISQGFVRHEGDITPSQLTADQNDWSPTGLSTARRIRTDSSKTIIITGLAGGADGRRISILNHGLEEIVFASQNTGSSASNRFQFPESVILLPEQEIEIEYDSTDSRWKLISGIPTRNSIVERTRTWMFNDCYGTAAGVMAPFVQSAIASGTVSAPVGENEHPGINRSTSSTSANSGISTNIGTSPIQIQGGEQFECILRFSTFTNTTTRIGFGDQTGSNADFTDGIYFEMATTSSVSGKTASNSSRSTTASSFTASTATWYHFKINVISGSLVEFYIYSDAGALLWSDTLTANIPTGAGRQCGPNIQTTNSGTSATDLIDIDWIGFTTGGTDPLIRGLK